jgi:hypothetical protein
MDEDGDAISQIYEAVGDAECWRRVTERLALAPPGSANVEKHLEIAQRAHDRCLALAGEIETLAAVYNQLALAALVVDNQARLLRANTNAAILLADGDSLSLSADLVRTADADANIRLCDAIARAASGRSERRPLEEPFILVRRPRRQPMAVLVLAATDSVLHVFEGHLPVILLVIDPERIAAPATTVLSELFGFTDCEAGFAVTLLQGLSVKEAAHALGVTLATARTFLAHIAEKTDSHSQAELVRQLLAIPGVSVSDQNRHV